MSLSSTLGFIPPMRDGVSASQVYLPQLPHHIPSVFAYLCSAFAHINAQEWQQRFIDGLIIDMQGRTLTLNSPYIAKQHIYYYRFLDHEIHIPFYEKILFENDDLLVVDKPHFLTMSPTGQYLQETLLVRLKRSTGNAALSPIHRLDRETAGVVLFSKRPQTRGKYQQRFAERLVEKTYHAIAAYHPQLHLPMQLTLRLEKSDPFYIMRVADGEANTTTQISLLEHNEVWAKYVLRPKTGKQHQLRVHLNYLGIPIRNDHFYPVIEHQAADDFSAPLQLLAHQIRFTDPLDGEQRCFYSQQTLNL